jgi:multidrug efflux pump subunit AcrA (membrane-fusion protein)
VVGQGRSPASSASKFVPVTTGITGATDIEVLTGLNPGDEIVTGRFKPCAP